MTPHRPVCFLEQGPSAALHMHVGLGDTGVCFCHIPPAGNTPSPLRSRGTHICTYMYTCILWHSKKRVLLTGGNSSRVEEGRGYLETDLLTTKATEQAG